MDSERRCTTTTWSKWQCGSKFIGRLLNKVFSIIAGIRKKDKFKKEINDDGEIMLPLLKFRTKALRTTNFSMKRKISL